MTLVFMTGFKLKRSILVIMQKKLKQNGAKIIGGCCRTTPNDISKINAVR